MKVKEQIHTDNYSLYNGDCIEVVTQLEDNSIDLSIYSPPFAGLYNYSSDHRDMSNCESKEQFLDSYEFLIKEMARITKAGRINAVHCQDIVENTTKHNLWDFPHEIIKLHKKYGFTYNNRITIWKEPLEVRNRTMVKSLMHKQIVQDSTLSYPAVPDYLLIFRRVGENKVPVTHENGINEYFGAKPILDYTTTRERSMKDKYGEWEHIDKKYEGHEDHKTNKKSHIIWQRYASSVWDDIRSNNVLPFRDSKEEDDEKHVHPLQLDVIDRVIQLYSNPNEVILTPFMGVGSEVYSPVSQGRKAIGIELKDSYYKQALINVKHAENRFKEKIKQKMLF
jgi:DNA modification methylase